MHPWCNSGTLPPYRRTGVEVIMPEFICITCGTQYAEAEAPPAGCAICQDERQYVNPLGQSWTTLPAMRRTHLNSFRQHVP